MPSYPPPPGEVRLFASDLDGTLVGNPAAAFRFKRVWQSLALATRPFLVYNSGRLVDDLRRLVERGELPAAEYYIGGVGTQIYDVGAGASLEEYDLHLRPGWDLGLVHATLRGIPGLRPQPDEFQHPLKSSWFLERAAPVVIREIRERLLAAGVAAQVVYSSARDLDILPANATKAGALAWLCSRLNVALDSVLVAGDTGNDAAMFRLPGVRGIVVRNAHPELRVATAGLPTYCSREIMADGVLDGLRHFGVIRMLSAPKHQRPTAVP